MSSLFSALTVAVGGLTAQSDALGNISDNLSNAQTTGFKSIGTSFQSLVTQSNAADNEPGGVRAAPQYQNDVQGNLVQSATPTSLAISGQGYFSVETASANADGTTNFTGNLFYTREGDYTLNNSGYLVNGSGYYLLGYSVAQDGTVNKSTTAPVQISALLNNPVATTSATYTANLPSSAANAFASSASTINVFDASGNTHSMTFTWTKVSTNKWNLAVDVAGGSTITSGADYLATIPFTFNGTTNVGTVQTITAGTGYTVPTPSTGAAEVSLNLDFPGSGGAENLLLNFGKYNSATGLTQFSGTDVSVSSFTQDGLPQGSFNSLTIDKTGNVAINYSNGSTRIVAQIPIAQFNAQDQLQRVTGNAYSSTLASGSANLTVAGSNGSGFISSGSLESSNVDIATQFTNMIQAQQVYSANAKVITTVDNMLNTIINTIQ